jgi:hypothetical protein
LADVSDDARMVLHILAHRLARGSGPALTLGIDAKWFQPPGGGRQDLERLGSPRVERIRLVQDNLNTHTPGSVYHVWPPDEAFAFAQPLAWHDTPTQGSWLTMAAIEVSALSTPCLDRRIPDQAT